jgi:glutamine amidotransferase
MDLINPIKEKVEKGIPFFGICLGMQLVFSKSEEFGSGKGLNLIPGLIKKFPESINGNDIKVPHISWNKIYAHKKIWKDTPLYDIDNNEYMYFVHSYYVSPFSEDSIITKTNYEGIEYCSAILKDNIFATQFHPEKSSEKGLKIYKNWGLINNLL